MKAILLAMVLAIGSATGDRLPQPAFVPVPRFVPRPTFQAIPAPPAATPQPPQGRWVQQCTGGTCTMVWVPAGAASKQPVTPPARGWFRR